MIVKYRNGRSKIARLLEEGWARENIISILLAKEESKKAKEWTPKQGDLFYFPSIWSGGYDNANYDVKSDAHRWIVSNNLAFKTREESVCCMNRILEIIAPKEESKPVEECKFCMTDNEVHHWACPKNKRNSKQSKPVELPEIDKITLGIKDIHFGAFITFGDKINEIIDRLNILTKGR